MTKCLACASRYYGAPVRGIVAVGGVLLGRRRLAARVAGLHYCSNFVKGEVSGHLLHDLSNDELPIERVIGGFHVSPSGPGDESVLAQLPPQPYILFVGALRQVKGVEDLLLAYGRLRDAPPLVFMGPQTPDTPSQVLSHRYVLPSSSYDTVIAAWRRALFGVAPSRLPEPFGNVIHEAMSCGRAVIGTGPSGMSDMIEDGVNGFLVPRGDPDSLAGAMARLLADEDLRRSLGDAAITTSKQFLPEVVIPEFESLYHEAISRAAR